MMLQMGHVLSLPLQTLRTTATRTKNEGMECKVRDEIGASFPFISVHLFSINLGLGVLTWVSAKNFID